MPTPHTVLAFSTECAGPSRTVPSGGKGNANRLVAVRLRVAYRLLQLERGSDVSIRHVKSHTGIRGNEAADKLAKTWAPQSKRGTVDA